MYLAVDIGGTKTLLVAFDDEGTPKKQVKFPTSQDYQQFLRDVQDNLPELNETDFLATGVGVPGLLDRENGIVLSLGNLSWQNEPIQADLEKISNSPVSIENDAKLAGLYEAMLVVDRYKRTLYLTISTGIGIALIVDGKIDTDIGDAGGNGLLLEHRGKILPWEDFASGKAIVKQYGKKAGDISDPAAWKEIARNLAVGMIGLIAILEPEVIIIGGGVGSHFQNYGDLLVKELNGYATPSVKIPPVLQAQRPEEAVLYGCFELVRAKYGALHASHTK